MKISARRLMVLLTTVAAVAVSFAPANAVSRKRSRPRTPFAATSGPYADTLTKVGADLDAFWSVEMPRIYKISYQPLVGFYPYSSQALPPKCGMQLTFSEIAGNAFYCQAADYIAFDNEGLFPELYDGFGDIALGMVLAHEFGHAVQARSRTRLPSVYAELQADCFAGAWLRRVSDGKSPYLKLSSGVIEDALGATLAFRDRPGIAAESRGAHGNGFDRTGAVQLGFDEGTQRCAKFRQNPPTVTATGFTAASEAASGGDVALDEAVRITTVTANRHFASVPGFVPITSVERTDRPTVAALTKQCPNAALILDQRVGVCPDSGSGLPLLRVSDNALQDAATKVGDVGASIILVLGWTARVQQLQGEPTHDASVSAELRSTCLAGTWLGATQRGETGVADDPVSLSPGDVDEALIALIRVGGLSTTFDRVRALRIGFSAKAPFTACSKF